LHRERDGQLNKYATQHKKRSRRNRGNYRKLDLTLSNILKVEVKSLGDCLSPWSMERSEFQRQPSFFGGVIVIARSVNLDVSKRTRHS
jgi:hypothetical protein